MKIKERTGIALKDLRENKKISQVTLSGLSGVDRTFISHIENGNRNVSIETLEKILKGLNVSFKDFFSMTIFS